jgi:hypothetical protein
VPCRVGLAGPAPQVTDSEGIQFKTNEDNDHCLGGMQKTEYFCFRCAEVAQAMRPGHDQCIFSKALWQCAITSQEGDMPWGWLWRGAAGGSFN